MIQDIGEGKLDITYERRKPRAGDRLLLYSYKDKEIFLKKFEDGRVSVPEYPACGEVECVFLFRISGIGYYTVLSEKAGMGAEADFAYEKLAVLRRSASKELRFAGATGWQLYKWYMDNRFCGRCGAKMGFSERERAVVCPECKYTVYPKIMPAVIIGVTKGDDILMTRYRGREYKGHALVAGFCEIGETPEDTVRREVMEEAGIRVKNIRYYKSQPWGFEQDLLLGFYCEVDGDSTIKMDKDELSEAVWINRNEIEEKFEDMSLTNEMIVRFKENGYGGE
ncbi:MAG: NAD(+) diphosphatase [Lachnospiraceae bacterium]|nr:NAD(+) diphosphatase [Lachnospiraceae bacterium]